MFFDSSAVSCNGDPASGKIRFCPNSLQQGSVAGNTLIHIRPEHPQSGSQSFQIAEKCRKFLGTRLAGGQDRAAGIQSVSPIRRRSLSLRFISVSSVALPLL